MALRAPLGTRGGSTLAPVERQIPPLRGASLVLCHSYNFGLKPNLQSTRYLFAAEPLACSTVVLRRASLAS
jgi:hypothetical protein